MSESFAALFEESQKRSEMRIGEVVTAEVVRIEHNFVVVNAGLKSEAYVPLSEFKSDKGEVEVQVGDFVSVAIVPWKTATATPSSAATPPSVSLRG
jgi:small subunit ribosomal protein S1